MSIKIIGALALGFVATILSMGHVLAQSATPTPTPSPSATPMSSTMPSGAPNTGFGTL